LLGKLVQAHGALLPATAKDLEGLSHLFPSPSRIAKANLAVLGMPNVRAIAVTSLAQAISADPTIFSRGASLEEAIAKLRSLAGIGEWTAQYIAMRELREPDAFPAADIGLMRAMATPDGRRPSPPELLSRAERWRPWRAYAALHLWAAAIQAPTSSRKTHEREAA
jgi:AraC family transcriptional regulator of adaptative response / DNA-3-methyladenine glycosylase II